MLFICMKKKENTHKHARVESAFCKCVYEWMSLEQIEQIN